MNWFGRKQKKEESEKDRVSISGASCNPIDLHRIKTLTNVIAAMGRNPELKIFILDGYVLLEIQGRDIPKSIIQRVMSELPPETTEANESAGPVEITEESKSEKTAKGAESQG